MTEYRTGKVSAPSGPSDSHRTWYSRALGLKNIRLSGLWSVVFFEGSIALALLLALTEQISWWVVVAFPVAVAAMVKLNDVVAGVTRRSRG